MRALVFANGDPPPPALAAELAAAADLVVAADGGLWRALEAGVQPDCVVGDLDSAGEPAATGLPPDCFLLDADPNRTDLQKAIRYAIDHGCREVDVLAAGGGRADHALANLSVLPLYRGLARVRLVDDSFEISLVEGEADVDGTPGTVVSLVAIGRCTGVTTQGLRWDLDDFTLDFSPRGVHNELVGSHASVSVRDGDLLLFKGRWVEKHR